MTLSPRFAQYNVLPGDTALLTSAETRVELVGMDAGSR